MQQKVLLVCKNYLFCINFSLNNLNYPNKKLAIPSKLTKVLRNTHKTFAEEFKTCLGFEVMKSLKSLFLSNYMHYPSSSLC